MVLKDKKTLYRLLNEYMSGLLELDEENIKRRKDRKENGRRVENYEISGVKAQFNHARERAEEVARFWVTIEARKSQYPQLNSLWEAIK